MTVLHAIALAALLFEDDNLLTLDECFHDFYYYLGTFNSRCTNCDCALVVYVINGFFREATGVYPCFFEPLRTKSAAKLLIKCERSADVWKEKFVF